MFREINGSVLKGFLIDVSNNIAEIWFPYSIEIMKVIREGTFLAVKNFASIDENNTMQQVDDHYSILEVTSKKAVHYKIEDIKLKPRGILLSETLGQFREAWNRQLGQSENPDIKIIVYAFVTEHEIYIPSDLSRQTQKITDKFVIRDAKQEPILGEEVYGLEGSIVSFYINDKVNKDTLIIAGKHKIYGIDVHMNYEELIRRHFGIFGFTGSGKSNLASTLINKIMQDSKTDANVLIFDVNNEYFGLLFDTLLDLDSHIIFLDSGALGSALSAYLSGDYIRLDEAAQELVLSSNLSIAIKNATLGKNTLIDIAKILLDTKRVKIFEQGILVSTFVSDIIGTIQNEVINAASQKVKQFLTLIIETIKPLFLNQSERNVESNDLARILKILDLFKNRNATELKNFLEKLEISLEFDEKLFSDNTVANNINRIDAILKKLEGLKKNLDVALIYQQTIGLGGLFNILHDSKGSLLIFLAEDDNLLRNFSYFFGQMIYQSRKNKRNKIDGKIIEPPTLFFFEEADMFIPSEPTGTKEEKESIKNSIDIARTLARRGRKYNLGLGIATQRSRYLNTSIMGQISTYLIGKLPRKVDRDVIIDGFGVEENILDQTLKFITGDWLAISHANTLGVTATPLPMHFDNADERLINFLEFEAQKIIDKYRLLLKRHDYVDKIVKEQPSAIFRDITEEEVAEYYPEFIEKISTTTDPELTVPEPGNSSIADNKTSKDSGSSTDTREKDTHAPKPPSETPPPVSSLSGYKAYLESLISTGSYTQRELVEMVHGSYPDVKEATINTMITDSRNPKYNKLSKLTTKTADGKIIFV